MPHRAPFGFAKNAALLLSLASAALASGQTYRQTFPLPDGSDVNSIGVTFNLPEPTDAQAQKMQDAGFKYVRFDFTWAGIEKTKGVYDWSTTDRAMAKFQAHGLRVDALLAYSNALYTTTGAPNTAACRTAFANFAAAAAARYKGRGALWEIYNEPNLAGWWPNPNPVDYALLANQTAGAIRAVAPDEWIIGLTTALIYADNSAYIASALDNGILNNLDAIAPHPYTKFAPETMTGGWSTLKTMIDYRRGDKPISVLASEVGVPRTWTNGNLTLQSVYTLRTVLMDMIQGVGLTNLYTYQDIAGDPNDWHNTAGFVALDGPNTPYPVYYSVQRLTANLKNYKFAKRLSLPSANDYAMLFSNPANPSDCRVVVWTTGAAHAVSLPSSAVSFSTLALASGATGMKAASGGLLGVTATSEPTVYASLAANPVLAVVSGWAKLPDAVKLSTRADAVAQLGGLLVSPAWASAPAGATLKVEDAPTAVPGYTRPAYTATLGGLSTLTLDSPAVQTVFNSLGALQDEMDKPRSLTFTLTFPDGSTAVQRASVSRVQPMALYPTMPCNWALSLRVENPSGLAFNGTVKASSGALSVPIPIAFAAGQTSQQVNFPTISNALLGTGFDYGLYDASGNVLVPSTPTISPVTTTVFRAPNIVSGGGYSVALGGSTAIPASASLSYSLGTWSFLTGGTEGDITYSFGAASGSRYLAFGGPAGLTSAAFPKVPISVGMWVYGDGSGNTIRTQLVDGANQTFLATYGVIDWTGWKWVNVPIAGNLAQHWGGANDGVVRGSMRVVYPFILDSNNLGSAGRVSLMGITVVGQK